MTDQPEMWEILFCLACMDKLQERFSPQQIADALKAQEHSGETLFSRHFHAGDDRYLSFQVWVEHCPDLACDGFSGEDQSLPLETLNHWLELARQGAAVH